MTLAQLNHPSIARLYDADTLADGTPCFVMEYVEGIPLTDYCSRHRCSIEERLRLFRSVCEAVQYAHAQAVIHRDLKPSNLLVKADGTVRLLDFGISKQIDTFDHPADQTMTELRFMTPAYAAPEQVRGERVGIHTDVYSLGVILYELLTGRLPLDLSHRTRAEAETIIVEREPDKPSAVARLAAAVPSSSSGIPSASEVSWADLDVLCLTAMHKDVQRRYRSVEALIRDVDHYLTGEPLDVRPPLFGYRMGKFVRRNRRAVAATGLAATVVLGLVIFYTMRLASARNAALAEAARTERIQRFVLNLFQGGDESVGPSEDLRVVTLLDRGIQEAQILNAEPQLQAELYETLGSVCQNLGEFDRADSLLRAALEKRKSVFGHDHAEVANSLVALGLLRADQAQFENAERLVRQGLAMARRHLPPEHPLVAKAMSALGRVLENRGEYDQAIKVLNEAVQVQSAPGGRTADLAVSLTDLANSHFYAGHYGASDSLNRRVLDMDRQLYGNRHPNVAEDLLNLAAIQVERAHYQEAERFNREALDIIRSWFGKDHPETASAMTLLARVLIDEKHYEEAAGLLQPALAIQERVYGKVHPRVASALNDLGKVAMQERKLDEAEADFNRVTRIYRRVYGDRHYYIANALSNLASVYIERKQYIRAERLLREVVRRYTDTLSADHPYLAIARIKLGRVLLHQRRHQEAAAESLAGCRILVTQSNPPVTWLRYAREDLAMDYEALKQPKKAAELRAELANTNAISSH